MVLSRHLHPSCWLCFWLQLWRA